MEKRWKVWLTVAAVALLVGGCALRADRDPVGEGDYPGETLRTETPSPSPTPTPSPAPIPSQTPEPEWTPEPERFLPHDTIQAPIPYPFTGEMWGYNSLEEDGWLFEWVLTNEQVELPGNEIWDKIWMQKLLVSQVTDGGLTFEQMLDLNYECLAYAWMPYMGAIEYIDVDFDGEKDILVCLGSYGAQGALGAAAFLRREDGFVESPSFADIANPSVAPAEREIRSSWRDGAATHSYAAFEYLDGEFVETRRLTEEPIPGSWEETGDYIMQWTEEKNQNGEMTVTRVWRQDEMTEEELEEFKYRDPDWGIYSKKWNEILFCDSYYG